MKNLYLRAFSLSFTLFTFVFSVHGQDPYPAFDNDNSNSNHKQIGSTNPVGSIIALAGEFKPAGYLFCDGRTVQVSEYPELYNAIGNTYGGNSTSFKLPDLRGYFLRGWSADSNRDSDKNSRNNGGNKIGSSQDDQFKSHNHAMQSGGNHRHGYYHTKHIDNSNHDLSDNGDNDAWRGKANTDYAGSHTHTINNSGGTESRPKNVAVGYYIKATSHEMAPNKIILGVTGTPSARAAFIDYENTKGLLVSHGTSNDHAFFGMKNRGGESGNANDFNTVIYFGDDVSDNLIFESQDGGELLELSAQGVLKNENIQITKNKITGDGIGNTRAPLLLTDQDTVALESKQIRIGTSFSDELTLKSSKLNILSDVYGRINPLTGTGAVNFKDAVYIESEEGLVVSNLIKAQDIDITPGAAPAAPDYVFLKDYNLLSIEEVDQYIKDHGHLPEVPSATEIAENGYSVNEMDFTLLKKIEEITLYIISLEEEKENLKQENNQLQDVIKSLQERLTKVEERIR